MKRPTLLVAITELGPRILCIQPVDQKAAEDCWVFAGQHKLCRVVVLFSDSSTVALNQLSVELILLVERVLLFYDMRDQPHYKRKASRHDITDEVARPWTYLFDIGCGIGVSPQGAFDLTQCRTIDPRKEPREYKAQFLGAEFRVTPATAGAHDLLTYIA